MIEIARGFFQLSIRKIIIYFALLTVSFHDLTSLLGFFTFLFIFSQLISGTMLAFSLVPEPMLIPMVRDEEDIEDLYADDFFWLHERGVDFIFIFSYLHLFRKLYLNVFEYENAVAWQSGVFVFLIFQVVVFLGLVLCCTHLSEITLTIAANIFHTFFAFKGKFYWWIFTDKQLNVDTTIRLAYGHYVSAFVLAYLGLIHGIDMHYDWKNETSFDGIDAAMVWWDEALTNELGCFLEILVIFSIIAVILFEEPEALSYEIFMWGDIGLMSDVRFYGVAPHWYFRPFMAWLITCPHHKTGIFGLLFYFFCLFYQPVLHGISEQNNYSKRAHILFLSKLQHHTFYTTEYANWEAQIYHQITYGCFVGSCFYVSSFLPYGRFYNRLGGNVGTLYAYMYIFLYLALPIFRKPLSIELYTWSLYTKLQYLNHVNKSN